MKISAKDAKRIFASASKIDKAKLRADFDTWPSLATKSWSEANPPRLDKKYESILFAGLGGSGIIGEVMSDLAAESGSVRIETLKDYHVPKYVGPETLVIGVSCSGNTEETISVVMEARQRNIDVCTFGSGGFLETIVDKNVRFTKTSMLKVPRSSFPGLFFPVLKFMMQNGYLVLKDGDVHETLAILEEANATALSSTPNTNAALKLGLLLGKRGVFPLVYSSRRTRSVGLRFRQSINENAKLHAYDGVIPELCHNEVVAWDSIRATTRKQSRTESFLIVNLRFEDDPEELKTRFDIVEDIAKKSGAATFNAPYMGISYLARMVSMLYLLDYATYYAALARGINPIVTPSIDLLKNQLKERLNYLTRFSSQ